MNDVYVTARDRFEIGGEGILVPAGTKSHSSGSDTQEGAADDRQLGALEDIRVRVGTLEPISKSFKQYQQGCELHKAQEVVRIVLPARHNTALPLEPGKKSARPSTAARSDVRADRPVSCAASDSCDAARSSRHPRPSVQRPRGHCRTLCYQSGAPASPQSCRIRSSTAPT